MSKSEYRGYGLIADQLKKLSLFFSMISAKIKNLAERVYFEQFKLLFGESDEDIYITTYPKSGTTLMQMILYHLTTDGSMDFNHIYEVSPWIRNDSYNRIKPRKLSSPRLIKTHDKYHYFEKGTKGRFIFIYRDGMDVAVSLYNQNKNYNMPDLKFESYLKKFFKKKEWFKFCQAWFKNKYKFPVLYIKYENLLADKPSEIKRIIDFLNIKPTQMQVSNAISHSSFEYMKKHEEKFGEPKAESKKVYDQFIRKGKSGEGKELFTETQKREFKESYMKYVQKGEKSIFN